LAPSHRTCCDDQQCHPEGILIHLLFSSASVRQNLLSLQSTAVAARDHPNDLATATLTPLSITPPLLHRAGANNRASDISTGSMHRQRRAGSEAANPHHSLQSLVGSAQSIANQVLQARSVTHQGQRDLGCLQTGATANNLLAPPSPTHRHRHRVQQDNTLSAVSITARPCCRHGSSTRRPAAASPPAILCPVTHHVHRFFLPFFFSWRHVEHGHHYRHR